MFKQPILGSNNGKPSETIQKNNEGEPTNEIAPEPILPVETPQEDNQYNPQPNEDIVPDEPIQVRKIPAALRRLQAYNKPGLKE